MIAKRVDLAEMVPETPVLPHQERLAVYGTLRRDFGAHGKLKGANFVGSTYICGYEMISMGSFPGVFKVADLDAGVYVEIYDVDKDAYTELDWYEGHPGFYCRTKIPTVHGDVWCYLLPSIEKYTSLPRIKSGKWGDSNHA